MDPRILSDVLRAAIEHQRGERPVRQINYAKEERIRVGRKCRCGDCFCCEEYTKEKRRQEVNNGA